MIINKHPRNEDAVLRETNAESYQKPEFFRKVNGDWQKINQEVYGNDFWQTEYNASTKNWDITYNINLDSPNNIQQTVEFRFANPNLQ